MTWPTGRYANMSDADIMKLWLYRNPGSSIERDHPEVMMITDSPFDARREAHIREERMVRVTMRMKPHEAVEMMRLDLQRNGEGAL